MKLVFTAFSLVLFLSSVYSQQRNLSSEDLQKLQKRAEKYVFDFEKMVSDIAGGTDMSIKQTFINAAVEMFEDKATIEVSSVSSQKKSSFPIRKYLTNLSKLIEKYSVVTITFNAGFIDIEKLKEKKDDNGETFYEGSFTIKQCFCASKTNIKSNDVEMKSFQDCSAYGDCTTKKIKVVIKKVMTIKGEKWVVKLSDIKVEETNSIK